MSDFTVVPEGEFPKVQRRSEPSALSLALEAGHVVFVAGGEPKGLRNKHGYLTKRGFRVSQRAGERDGVQGYYVRASKNGAK